jgi:hypothetical protein
MRKTSCLLIGALALTGSLAGAAKQTVIIPVAINADHVNDGSVSNPNEDPLTVIALCGATAFSKTVEGWVKKSSGSSYELIASTAGAGRLSIDLVAPWQWAFKVVVTKQGGGTLPAGVCKATAWWTE